MPRNADEIVMFVSFSVVVLATSNYFLYVQGILTPIIPHRHLNRGNLCRNKRSSLKLQTDAVGSFEIVSNDSRSSKTDNKDSTPFSLLASLAAACILESELKRNAMRPDGSQTPSSAANWIDDRSAYKIQSALNQIELKVCVIISMTPVLCDFSAMVWCLIFLFYPLFYLFFAVDRSTNRTGS